MTFILTTRRFVEFCRKALSLGSSFLIVGIGINVKSSPKIKKYPTTYLNKEADRKKLT
jgi:biotin-(acetyl-CoA carboxylase) ligase